MNSTKWYYPALYVDQGTQNFGYSRESSATYQNVVGNSDIAWILTVNKCYGYITRYVFPQYGNNPSPYIDQGTQMVIRVNPLLPIRR
jgi:hypothetical protein